MEEDNYRIVINLLEQISTSVDNNYRDDANWYLSLCYLKLQKTEKALTYLERLQANPQNKYYERTKNILKGIKRNLINLICLTFNN